MLATHPDFSYLLTQSKRIKELQAENARLKAEVEWLKEFYDLSVTPNRELQAQVERLTKAGYAMAIKINVHGIKDRFTDSQKLVEDWSNAAKEGKQS